MALSLPGMTAASRPLGSGFVIEESGNRLVGAFFGLRHGTPVSPALQALFGGRYRDVHETELWNEAAGACIVMAGAEPSNGPAWRKASAFCRNAVGNGAAAVILYACGAMTEEEIEAASSSARDVGRCCIVGHAGKEPGRLSFLSYLHHGEPVFARRDTLIGVDFNDVAQLLADGRLGALLEATGEGSCEAASGLMNRLDGKAIGKRVAAFNAYGSLDDATSLPEIGELIASLGSRFHDGWGICNFDLSGSASREAVVSIHLFFAPMAAEAGA